MHWHWDGRLRHEGIVVLTVNTLVLHFQTLVSNLEAIHLFNGSFGRHYRVIRYKPWEAMERGTKELENDG